MWSFLCITYLNHRNIIKKKKKGNLGSLEAYRSLYAFLKIKSDAHEGVMKVCVSLLDFKTALKAMIWGESPTNFVGGFT